MKSLENWKYKLTSGLENKGNSVKERSLKAMIGQSSL